MENENPLITVLTLIFGILIGMVTIATLFYYVGVVNERSIPDGKTPLSVNAMDVLRGFTCDGTENPQIMTFGVEDDYLIDSQGSELTQLRGKELTPDRTLKIYDDPDQSKSFEESLLLPEGSEQGLLVIKTRAVTPEPGSRLIIETRFANEGEPWRMTVPNQAQDEIYQFRTRDLVLTNGDQTRSLADLIVASDQAQEVQVRLSPNMQADMIGYSFCPNEQSKTGTVMQVAQDLNAPGFIQLNCVSGNGSACLFETGSTVCDQTIPLACFSKKRELAPDLVGWSGGRIQFTPAVSGETFETADDAHLYCRKTFGDGWRVLSFMDGSANGVITGRGDASGVSTAWVDVGARPRANCWGNRAAYDNGAEIKP